MKFNRSYEPFRTHSSLPGDDSHDDPRSLAAAPSRRQPKPDSLPFIEGAAGACLTWGRLDVQHRKVLFAEIDFRPRRASSEH